MTPLAALSDPVLEGVQNNFWVRVFGGSKYIVLLYDAKGEPLWASGLGVHKHNNIVEELLKGPLHHFYSLPLEGDLPGLFQLLSEKENEPVLYLESVDPGRVANLPDLNFPSFSSKNLIEGRALAAHFIIRYPLTRIFLIRLTGDRFAGVVSFPDIYGKLLSLENKTSVLVDDNHHILGFNSLFSRPLKLKDPAALLGRNLFDILNFSRDPRQGPADPPLPLASLFEWKFPESAPFRLADPAVSRLLPSEKGLRWEHLSGKEYAYLPLPCVLPVEESHFKLEIEFLPGGAKIPRLIFRGLAEGINTAPDLLGYTFSGAPGDRELAFKKNSHPVKYLAQCPVLEGAVNTLTVKKTYDIFSFFLNGAPLGEWRETSPFIFGSDGLVYLFIREGESLTLRSLRLSRGGFDPRSTDAPLTATYQPPVEPVQLKASFFQGILEHQNFFLYHFEDITTFKQDIDNLIRERDSLAIQLGQAKDFVGNSKALQAIRSALTVVAPSNLTVIIEGETGVGKEVVAKAIHAGSDRKTGVFVKIDCSAIPAELIESELFGYEKGAFTGAAAAHSGRFEQANGGTVFLDEIGNLPLPVQAKLLHVLQDFEVHRLGGKKPVRVDVRVIAASNVSLEKLLAAGRLRTDFFYRLNQYRFYLPPLRERREDIPALVQYFLGEAGRTYKKPVREVTPEAMEKLCQAPWPGNVRELRNVILRAALFCRGEGIAARDIVLEESRGEPAAPGRGEAGAHRGRWGGMRRKVELSPGDFRAALSTARGNLAEAVRKLAISRSMAYKLIRRHKITLGKFRD